MTPAYSQKDSLSAARRVNTLFVEAAGNCGTLLSINYGHILNEKKKNLALLTGIRVGYGYGLVSARNRACCLFTMNTPSRGNHHFESGLGFAAEYTNQNRSQPDSNSPFRFAFTMALLYRWQKNHEGFCFRMGATPTLYQELFFYPPKDRRPEKDGTQFNRTLNIFMPCVSVGTSF
jgi:hypothetical protein